MAPDRALESVSIAIALSTALTTLVLNRKANILRISYDISIHQQHSNIPVDVC